jgi:hypothetical protein
MGTQNSDTSPLEALEWAVLNARANREELEQELVTLPRWRFRRRRVVARSVRRRHLREQQLQKVLTQSNGQPPPGLTLLDETA